jgi:nitrile hydratase
MDGIHDLGGMDGFGSIEIAADEPVFHEPWEGWTYALYVAGMGNEIFNIDEFRHSIERMDPDEYLDAAYYERWLTAIERLFVEKGVLDEAEIDARMAALESGDASVPERSEPDLLDDLFEGVAASYAAWRDHQEPAFTEGDRVRVRNIHPRGHTRCPRYVRRAEGVVAAVRGTFVLPDSRAHGGDDAEPVYNVRFEGEELFGSAADAGEHVHIELWESYLETADDA